LGGVEMKRLTLIRHAKSSWKDPVCTYFDRPLAKRGKNDALTMGKRFAERGDRPSLIVSSPAKRAMATMKRMVGEMGIPEKKIVRDGRLYHGGSSELLAFVREIEDIYNDAMVCGHNPALTDFCNLISGSCIDSLPTCGTVTIEFAVDSWQDITKNSGRIRSFDCPRELHCTDVVLTDP
jgi:phosphohistidine phosphatase